MSGQLAGFLQQYDGFLQSSAEVAGIEYRRLSIDSRTIQDGEFFVAIAGEVHDGHKFALQALEKGAAAIAVSGEWFDANDMPAGCVVVKDTLDFLQQLAAWHRRHFDIELVGITGSNGKTTTRDMIAAVLSKKYRVFCSKGNKNNHIGLPLMLLELDESIEIAVIEMGTNHPGEIGHLAALAAPTSAVITNIGKGHIGFFGSKENIFREKTSLFDALTENGILFQNMEDPFLFRYQHESARATTVGLSEAMDVYGEQTGMDATGRVVFRVNGGTDIQLNIPGRHNLMNALLATAVGMHYQVSEAEIKQALESFEATSQRMDAFEWNGMLVINDAYNANPDSVRAAIDYVASLEKADRLKILALGDMLELGQFEDEEHFKLGEFIAGLPIDHVFLYGPLARKIEAGVQQHKDSAVKASWHKTHAEIADGIRKVAGAGDVLLLKGSRGMRMEKILDELGVNRREDNHAG